jgi:hypothetical protein
MESARRGPLSRAAVAGVLLLVGLVSWGLWRVLSGSEDLPFAKGVSPPSAAHVTRNKTYSLAVPGGIRAMEARGVPLQNANNGQVISLQCSWVPEPGETRSLSVNAENSQTKAENTVAHFQAPITGNLRVDCAGWGAMFIPDADNRSTDTSGWALVLAVITLTIGASLGLSALRTTWERAKDRQLSSGSGEEDEVQGFVDLAPSGGQYREVRRGDAGDIGE